MNLPVSADIRETTASSNTAFLILNFIFAFLPFRAQKTAALLSRPLFIHLSVVVSDYV